MDANDFDAGFDADVVFKALADEGRRALLDALRQRDGQTLGDLCEVLPEITRFGVMKHLRLLEAAHLVVSEKAGRSKLHYLNPVPIREIHDRWISNYAEPFVTGLLALRQHATGPKQFEPKQPGPKQPGPKQPEPKQPEPKQQGA